MILHRGEADPRPRRFRQEGAGDPRGGATMIGSALTWYRMVETSRDRLMASFERQPLVARDLQWFEAKAATIRTVDDLMKDRRALGVVLSAFQLESQIDARAMIRKILTEPFDGEKSLANRLLDPRYRQMAEALQPAFASGEPFKDPNLVQRIVDGFKTNEFEKQQGERAPGMREVMYFKRMIGKVQDLPQIMADRTLVKVIRVGLGFPDQFGLLSYEQQKARLAARVDIEKFKDPAYVDKFVQRFLIQNELQSGGPPASPILTLLQPVNPNAPFQPIGINLLV